MKIGLILPGNLWFCPYVNIYTQILNDNSFDYEIVSWNRDGSEPSGNTVFNLAEKSKYRFTKFAKFWKYISFIKRILNDKKFDKIVIFGPQLGILLYPYLKKKYNKKFIFDYRDLSIEQLPFLKSIFKKTLSISYLNVISSIGFKKHLPQKDYILSHNFNLQVSSSCRESSASIFTKDIINIVTIGSIRDYEANLEVVKALENKQFFNLYFIGKGEVSQLLQNYVATNDISNVFFSGFYAKKEEADFIRNATFLNIYYPKVKSHASAMSNRFYNSLIFKRPMIVTSNSIQGRYVEEYDLGLSINDCKNLDFEIQNFKAHFDAKLFDLSSDKLLREFEYDCEIFNNKIVEFIRN